MSFVETTAIAWNGLTTLIMQRASALSNCQWTPYQVVAWVIPWDPEMLQLTEVANPCSAR